MNGKESSGGFLHLGQVGSETTGQQPQRPSQHPGSRVSRQRSRSDHSLTQVASSGNPQESCGAGPLSACPPHALSPAFSILQPRTETRGRGPCRDVSQRATEEQAKHWALTALQLSHPLQQRVQGALRLLPVSRRLIVEQGLLFLQFCYLAQQLPLQLPEPLLEHLSEVTGQRGIGHVPSELVLWGRGKHEGEVLRPVKKKL